MNFDKEILQEIHTIIEQQTEKELILSTFAKTDGEWKNWLADFSTYTNTSWNLRKSFPHAQQCIFKNQYVCHQNQYRQSSKLTVKKKLNTNCPAKLSVKIHFTAGKSRNVRSQNPCIITISGNHNHDINTAASLSNLKIANETKLMFKHYFEQGLTASQALQHHQTKLWVSEGITAVANTRINPKPRSVYHMWQCWRSNAYGSYVGSNMYAAIKNYALENPDLHIELKLMGSAFVCAVVTPLMMRVHKLVPQAAEIVFVDSTTNLDQTNCTLTVFLCGSPIGALPLGVVISTSQDQDSYTEGFNLLKKVLKDGSFFGNNHPSIFMSDDSTAEKNALSNAWPQSKQLLCIFHVLQAVWRWLLSTKNGIPQLSRPKLMQAFKAILYSACEDDAYENYQSLVETCAHENTDSFLQYVNRWMACKEQWCLIYRAGMLTRGQNTNNCCEATIRIIKDVVFNRNRLFNVVFGQKKLISFSKPPLPEAYISASEQEYLYKVRSESNPNINYEVDLSVGICTCPAGNTGAVCKHQKSILLHHNLKSNQLFQGTAKEKHLYATVAEGDSAPSESFFYDPSTSSLSNESEMPATAPLTHNESLKNSNHGQRRDQSSNCLNPELAELIQLMQKTSPSPPDNDSPMNTDGQCRTEVVVVVACDDDDELVSQETAGCSSSNQTHNCDGSDSAYRAENAMLLDRTIAQLKEKVCSCPVSDQLNEALKAFTKNLQTIKSNGQFFSALHNFGKEIIPFKNRGRRIKCQPTALARRRRLAARSSAPLGKGRPPSQIKKLHGYKRKRNLAFNVRENRANAKTHGAGH